MSVAFLFPGQGAQYPGMIHALTQNAAASATIARAADCLGYDVLALDSADALNSTVAVQLATFIASVAACDALRKLGATPDAAAGLSIGAFGAAVACGAIAFETALKMVELRATLMEQERPQGYGLSAIVGLSQRQVKALVESHSTSAAPVYLANLNAPLEVVIAGTNAGMDRVLTRALALGARRAERLPISVPSHCPLMEGVAAKMVSAMADLFMSAPRIPYIGNRSGRPLLDREAVREDLATNVAHPVRWHEATTVLFEQGARLFVEMPPGYKLTALATEAFPEARAVAVESNSIEFGAQLVRHYRTSTT